MAPEIPEVVKGDSTRLRQIIVNLVGNAIKFTSEGEVALRVQAQDKDDQDLILHFSVSDTGIGIPPEKQKVIFDPFTQADTSTTRRFGGTGLGLTISSRLVEMMNGKIWVESQVGSGAQFHFTACLGVADANTIEIGSIAPPEVLRAVKVLIVDEYPHKPSHPRRDVAPVGDEAYGSGKRGRSIVPAGFRSRGG